MVVVVAVAVVAFVPARSASAKKTGIAKHPKSHKEPGEKSHKSQSRNDLTRKSR